MKRFMIIDGNSLLFRAFYGTFRGDSTTIMRARNGEATNAIFALANIMTKIIDTHCPDYALVAFDSHEKTFRHLKYDAYKAGRKETPEDLLKQFPLAEELLEYLGFRCYKKGGYEADDIVGSMAEIAKNKDFEVEIFSGDRDLLQLIDDNVVVRLTKKGLSETVDMTKEALFNELGITPDKITDLKGLMGDSSDNLPGIPGVGEKTALKLLQQYGDLEHILSATDIKGKLAEKVQNGKQSALMCKELATICRTMPFEHDVDYFKYQGVDENKLRDFYTKYDLVSLLKKLPQKEVKVDINMELLSNISDEYLIDGASIIMEMMEDNYHLGNIIGLAISNGNKAAFIKKDDLIKDKKFISYLEDEGKKKKGYDIKRTIVALSYLGINVKGFDFDLPLASYIMDPTLKDDPASIYGYYNKTIPFIDNIYFRKSYDNEKVINYACLKAYYLFSLRSVVDNKLEEQGLTKLFYEIELPSAYCLIDMEETGINVDVALLKKKAEEVNARLLVLTSKIYELANKEFNINSPSQLGEVLFDELGLDTTSNKKHSTSAEVLNKLKGTHPIIESILEYRKYSKLQNTYLVGLQDYVMKDGKIHTIYNQMLTQTGRLSSKDPNLQNITARDEELKEVRQAFTASQSGNNLVSFDYSQIELRVLAHMANANSLIEAFNNGEDIHSTTASKVFNLPKESITSEMRRQAKVVNFGIIYGMSEWGLSDELGINVNEAKDFISKYFASFPEIKQYLNKTIEDCKKNGYVRTLYGRYRYVREINDPNYNVREFGKRVAMNTPIQGTAADIIKIAMIKASKLIKEHHFETKMILQIHDELVFDVPYKELMEFIPLMEKCMNEAVKLSVPLKVEYEYGYTWFN